VVADSHTHIDATMGTCARTMCDIEKAKCDFCKEIKQVERTYLYPSKYIKSSDSTSNQNLYNEGDYFIIIKTCTDCGKPKTP